MSEPRETENDRGAGRVGGFDMSVGLASYLRNLADRVETGELCNGEVWERLYADGPAGPVEYEAGPSDATDTASTESDRS